ncbi:MAG: hypothetical protein NTX86_03090 [Candidatus Dependentiae bacterium]|nr:hypothetical protein [Candidatus Dependentiae bacterium]
MNNIATTLLYTSLLLCPYINAMDTASNASSDGAGWVDLAKVSSRNKVRCAPKSSTQPNTPEIQQTAPNFAVSLAAATLKINTQHQNNSETPQQNNTHVSPFELPATAMRKSHSACQISHLDQLPSSTPATSNRSQSTSPKPQAQEAFELASKNAAASSATTDTSASAAPIMTTVSQATLVQIRSGDTPLASLSSSVTAQQNQTSAVAAQQITLTMVAEAKDDIKPSEAKKRLAKKPLSDGSTSTNPCCVIL